MTGTSQLIGIHDREGAHIVAPGGWVLDTRALSEGHAPTNYAALRGDVRWIVRLNWGYGFTGTIPTPDRYQEFAQQCADYVARSSGCDLWIIGNEPNHENERPKGGYITPEHYARCFAMCRAAIKSRRAAAQVIPAPLAPYHANPYDWLAYWREMLIRIEADGGCDGIALHAYTRSHHSADIASDAKMGPPLQTQHSGFRVYRDALGAVPPSMQKLPAYITEFNPLPGWQDGSTGIIQAAAREIANWNRQPGTQKIHCLICYRWPRYDQWHIEGKNGVVEDLRAAEKIVVEGAPKPGTPDAYLPTASSGAMPPSAAWPARAVDPRATQRGVKIESPKTPAPGSYLWYVTHVQWHDEREAGGRHHILVDVVDENGARAVGQAVEIRWPSGSATMHAEAKPGEPYALAFGMSPSRNEYIVRVDGGNSEVVTGIGMGADTPGGFNAGIHTSTAVVFRRVRVPEATVTVPAPTQPVPEPAVGPAPEPVQPSKPAEPTPVPVQPPVGILDPLVAQTLITVESGGQAFASNGRPLIRFEAHVFRDELGNDALFNRHFRYGSPPWSGQQYRTSEAESWRDIHGDGQASEYAAFELALSLKREAAYRSISVGLGQIMGSNAPRVGFGSAEAMYRAFADSKLGVSNQLIGFLNFFLSDGALMSAVQRRDWKTIARLFNGPGNVESVAPLLEATYRKLGGT